MWFTFYFNWTALVQTLAASHSDQPIYWRPQWFDQHSIVSVQPDLRSTNSSSRKSQKQVAEGHPPPPLPSLGPLGSRSKSPRRACFAALCWRHPTSSRASPASPAPPGQAAGPALLLGFPHAHHQHAVFKRWNGKEKGDYTFSKWRRVLEKAGLFLRSLCTSYKNVNVSCRIPHTWLTTRISWDIC